MTRWFASGVLLPATTCPRSGALALILLRCEWASKSQGGGWRDAAICNHVGTACSPVSARPQSSPVMPASAIHA